MSIGSDLLALPFAEVVAQLAIGVSEAQRELDRNTVDRLLQLVKATAPPEAPDGREGVIQALERLKTAGLLPPFYQFVDTEVEVRMALSTSRDTSLGVRAGVTLSALTIDATYAQKYGYRAEGASVLRTKIVPVAPPEQLRALLEAAEAHRLLDITLPPLSPPTG
jgi:hypothetical protein